MKLRKEAVADVAFPLLILTIQNLLVFSGHYFNHYLFPWDFAQAYYGFTAFWTSAVDQGLFPQWVPFQAMGYPLALNLQSGLYYPPLWIFPALGLPYTLTAAVILQCLHVLFGGFGMFFLLRLKLGGRMIPLIGALMFQFFGGFYSNAEHVDIIRAFAFMPWLLFVFSFEPEGGEGNFRPIWQQYLFGNKPRNLFIPLFIYLMATGGYPGNFISGLFMLAIYVVLQTCRSYIASRSLVGSGSIALPALLLTIVGLAMSIVHLGPTWVEKASLTREQTSATIQKMGLWLTEIPTLYLSNASLPSEISMTSCYVTLPAVILCFFLPFQKLKEYWIEVVLLVLALLMVPGPRSPFFTLITKVLPPLNYSRFPTSDYRIFIGVILILLAAVALKSLSHAPQGLAALLTRASASIVFIGSGYFYFQSIDPLLSVSSLQFAAFLAVSVLTLAVLLSVAMKRWIPIDAALVLLALLVLGDGFRVLPKIELHRPGVTISAWRDGDSYSGYKAYGYPLGAGRKLAIYEALKNSPPSRPRRIDAKDNLLFPWAGYLTANYMTSDLGGTKMTAREEIERHPLTKEIMISPWSILLLRHGQPAPLAPNESVDQKAYGINEIAYEISLESPRLMVENEIYFKGWVADLRAANSELKIAATSIGEGLRAWDLPSGKYRMVAHFEFPNLNVYRAVSISAFLLWLVICGLRIVEPAPRGAGSTCC
ncbi:hypothetical protein [Geomonas ferrireducens]|uniref:hypothetical protein n=1 Tax=Geomonas ferrireducens TaxID=2570227 RepID=UPI0010A7614B|nr:hypothetical protein [Geomonas ferrireducens]